MIIHCWNGHHSDSDAGHVGRIGGRHLLQRRDILPNPATNCCGDSGTTVFTTLPRERGGRVLRPIRPERDWGQAITEFLHLAMYWSVCASLALCTGLSARFPAL